VADEVIIKDMKLLSAGKLKMTDGVRILEVRELIPPVKRKPAGKLHGKPQNKQFIKKKGHSRH
jgi:hypothetical protein